MSETRIIQFFVKLIDNKTLTLQFPSHQTLTSESIKQKIETQTQIPTQFQTLTLNGKVLSNSIPILSNSLNLSTISLNFSLVGGKGGFGSLLRGAATKAGQKKTNNFDACRDMSGRRLRHVNAEKRLEEWKSEQEERRLEKVAEDYLKKMAKKGKGGKKEEGAEKYVQKYREESARCVEDVEKSVRESVAELMANGKKRKLKEKLKGREGVDAKKLKVWMGKRKMGESESDFSDDDEESDGSDAENEKSVVINNGNQSDSSKDGSSGSVSVPQLNDGHHGGGSSDSGSDAEKEAPAGGSSASPSNMGSNVHENGSVAADSSLDAGQTTMDDREKLSIYVEMVSTSTETLTELDPREADPQGINVNGQMQSTTVLKEEVGPLMSTNLPAGQGASECKSASGENGSDVTELSQPLNFDNYNSAAELEVLGMERLKAELQARGLKCGGTLQERAARLFLLKTTPVEKLPKKLLAKK